MFNVGFSFTPAATVVVGMEQADAVCDKIRETVERFALPVTSGWSQMAGPGCNILQASHGFMEAGGITPTLPPDWGTSESCPTADRKPDFPYNGDSRPVLTRIYCRLMLTPQWYSITHDALLSLSLFFFFFFIVYVSGDQRRKQFADEAFFSFFVTARCFDSVHNIL